MIGRPKGKPPTMVYFARGARSGVYKVGCTNDLVRRASQLANYLDETVAMVRAFPGSYAEESAIVGMLAPFRATKADHRLAFPDTREMFTARGGLLDAVCAALPACDVVAHPPKRCFARTIRGRHMRSAGRPVAEV